MASSNQCDVPKWLRDEDPKAYPNRDAKYASNDYTGHDANADTWPLKVKGKRVGFRYQAESPSGKGAHTVLSDADLRKMSKLATGDEENLRKAIRRREESFKNNVAELDSEQ